MATKHPQAVLEFSREGIRAARRGDPQPVAYASLRDAAAALGGVPVLIALSRRNVFYRATHLPDAAREEIAMVLQAQAENLFPLGSTELAMAFDATPVAGPEGRLHRLAAVRDSEIESLFAQCREAGLNVVGVTVGALSSEAVASEHGMPDAIVWQTTPEGLALDVVLDGVLRSSRVAAPDADPSEEAQLLAQLSGRENLPLIDASDSKPWALDRLSAGHLELQPRAVAAKLASSRVAGRQRLAALFALAAVVAVAVTYLDFSDAQAAVNKEQAKTSAELRQAQNVRDAYESDLLKESANQTALLRLFEPAQSLGDVVVHCANLTPEGVWLTGISVDRGKDVTMRGTARDSQALAVFLDRLRASERLRDVRLVTSNNADIETTPVVQFSVAAFPVGNVPVQEEAGTRRRT